MRWGMVPDEHRVWAGRGVFAAVLVGICVALRWLGKARPTIRSREYWRLSSLEPTTLIGLAVTYIVFAIVPVVPAVWFSG
ncbi:MAG TPA: hypothetical protein VGG64_27935 [Pirellulales bacterium]